MIVNKTDPLPCEEKLTFDSSREAKAAAITLKWQRGTKLKAYRCTYCKLWHLTSINNT